MNQEKSTVEHTAEQVKATVHDAVTDTMAAADRTTKRAGEALESAADRLRERLPHEGAAGAATDAVSRGVKQTSRVLQQQGVSGIVEDLGVLMRRYPLQTLLLGLGCGYVISRSRAD
ncbi:MAG: hypothetical protein JNM35_00465 [Nitrospira sp.]|nr:hypothetical protein [Nitrospira sp.]